ncbi:SRPBCC domain-containing protein [Nocardia sp. BMG111209]|uniref:SRPBCC family protein n=1 Tax=Nocardia sp. BMG111209 TaxID=1160137 RepID=UPI0003654CB2|nr:SRPBCC domain-containing protein [Nocardia sp. BMG111209]
MRDLVETIRAGADERDVLTRYRAAVDADTARADRPRWADGRRITAERELTAPPEAVWQYWIDPALLETWWAPPSMTITECVIEPVPGGRVILDYRDAEERYRSAGRVHTADEPGHLAFDLSVLDAAGAVLFTGRYDLTLTGQAGGTTLLLDLTVTDTTVEAAAFITGIEIGWGQVLDNLVRLIENKEVEA